MAQKVLSKSWLAENPKGDEQASFTLTLGERSLPVNPDGSTQRIGFAFTADTWADALFAARSLSAEVDDNGDPATPEAVQDLVGGFLDQAGARMAEEGVDADDDAQASAWLKAAFAAEREATDWGRFEMLMSITDSDDRERTASLAVNAPGPLYAAKALEELSAQLGEGRIPLASIAAELCTAGGAGRDRGYDDEDGWDDEEDDSILIID